MRIKTHTTWGRALTPEESTIIEARTAKLLSEGVAVHSATSDNGTWIRDWDTIELANGWVEFANSLNPPPVKVEVIVTE